MKDKIRKIIKMKVADKLKYLLRENYSSKNLFEQFSLLEMSTLEQMTGGMQWINNNFPNSVLIGGTAVVVHLNGSRNITPDIDYLTKELSVIINKLDSENVEYDWIKDSSIGTIGITIPNFNIDLLDANIGSAKLFDLVLKTPTTTTIGGINIKIINPELLTIMKLFLGRNKDLNDAFLLLKSGKLNKLKYIGFVNVLKLTLKDDYESILGYSELI